MFNHFITKYTDIFVEKMCKSFSHLFWQILDINIWKFNETLTNDIVSFEQLGPEITKIILL